MSLFTSFNHSYCLVVQPIIFPLPTKPRGRSDSFHNVVKRRRQVDTCCLPSVSLPDILYTIYFDMRCFQLGMV